MKKQRGFINLDGLVTVFYLAVIGIVAVVGCIGYAVYSAIKYFI